ALADLPLAAMHELHLAERILNDLGEVQGGAGGGILLEAMMALDDLDVEALVLESERCLTDELVENVDNQAHVRGRQDRGVMSGGFDVARLCRGVSGGRDD